VQVTLVQVTLASNRGETAVSGRLDLVPTIDFDGRQ
jgi:hypothetical protein